MVYLLTAVLSLLLITQTAHAYSAAACTTACRNYHDDTASAKLCEQCATNMPLDYSMCTSACGYVDDVYNRWVDNICTRCFLLRPTLMLLICDFACKNAADKGNITICMRCYQGQ